MFTSLLFSLHEFDLLPKGTNKYICIMLMRKK